ncbi:MAG: DUF2721 domain-containing protein [Acidobacteriota bacterium]
MFPLPPIFNNPEFFTLSAGLAVLTSMITPALLLSATGTFILSTSTRLGRCIDRIRKISELLDNDFDPAHEVRITPDRKQMLLGQVEILGRRARLLIQVMQVLYLAAAMFVGTSVSIGIASVFVKRLSWMPITMGLGGACFLAYGTFRLIVEARMSSAGLLWEIEFMERGAEKHQESV